MIGITHFGIKKSNKYILVPEPSLGLGQNQGWWFWADIDKTRPTLGIAIVGAQYSTGIHIGVHSGPISGLYLAKVGKKRFVG